jgi:hypothetical protein
MEGPSINPLVNQARQKIEGKLRGPVSCPCCAGSEWLPASDLVGVWGQPLSYDPNSDVVGEKSPPLVMLDALMLVCTNCAFVRWHRVVMD